MASAPPGGDPGSVIYSGPSDLAGGGSVGAGGGAGGAGGAGFGGGSSIASALGSILGFGGSKQQRADAAKARAEAQAQAAAYEAKYGKYQGNLAAEFAPGTSNYNLLFGPRHVTSSESTARSGTSSTTPTITPQFAPDVASVQSILRQRLRGPGVPPGTAEAETRSIMDNEQAAKQRIANLGATTGAPTTGMDVPIETATAEQLANAAVARQKTARANQSEDLGATAQLASTFGKGQTQDYSDIVNSMMSQTSPADMNAILAFLHESQAPVPPTYFPASF